MRRQRHNRTICVWTPLTRQRKPGAQTRRSARLSRPLSTASMTVSPSALDWPCQDCHSTTRTSKTAAFPHRRQDRTPPLRTRGHRACSGRPASVTVPQAATRPMPTQVPAPAPYANPEQTPARPVRGRPWKSDGAHRLSKRPDAVRHASVDTATQRSTVTRDDIPRDKQNGPPSARHRSYRAVSAGGGR